jgi:hypothetical protein
MAADEIERFRREIVERTGDVRAGENLPWSSASPTRSPTAWRG